MPDSSITFGSGDIGAYSSPTVFQKEDNLLYMISGDLSGNFYGFSWNGSSWVTNNSIISGLTDIGDRSTPIVFQKDNIWYLISGESLGVFYGFSWNGSSWVTNNSIISGLTSADTYSNPTVFQKDNIWYLISGDINGLFGGFSWNGSSWVVNNDIISGLTDIGATSHPAVIQILGTWYLISGETDGIFNGFIWNGVSWAVNNNIILGLEDVGSYSSPTLFRKDDTWYIISGNLSGTFNGFAMEQIPTPYNPINSSILNKSYPPLTSSISFNWSDSDSNLYSNLIISKDIYFNLNAVDTITSNNFSVQSLAAGNYWWKVRYYNSTSGTYGNYSDVFNFTLTELNPPRLNITVFNEKEWGSRISNFNATIYNNTYSISKTTTSGWANFTSDEVAYGEYFVTVSPNSSYAPRSMLATTPTNATFYLPSTTSTIDTVLFYLIDYSGLYSWDTSVFTISRNNTVMHSSYFDADAKVGANLINGDSYQLKITNENNVYTWGNFVPMSNGAINLVILDTGYNATKYNPFVYNVTWNNSSIIASWSDYKTLISPGINFTIYKGVNKTQVHTILTTQPSGTSEYIVTDTNDIYYVYFSATTTNGNIQKYFVIDYRAGHIRGGGLNATGGAVGYDWNYGMFVMPEWVYNAAAWVLLLLLAGCAGYLHSGFMGIVTGIFAMVFWYWKWLDIGTLGPGFLGGVVLIIIIQYFKQKEHTS